MSAFTPDGYTPERAAEDAEQLTAVEPKKQPFWTLQRRRTAYFGVIGALIAAGVYTGIITAESTGAWLDALGTAGPGMAAMMGAVASLIMALRNPTPDNN